MTKPIPFVKFRFVAMALAILSIVAAFAMTFVQGGFRFGVDFQPGINLTVQFDASVSEDSLAVGKISQALEGKTYKFSVQTLGDAAKRTFVLRASTSGSQENVQLAMEGEAMESLKSAYGADKVQVVQSDYIGPSMSTELLFQTIGVTAASMILIFVYILFRFKIGYAMGAILSLVHDTLFVLGFIGFMGMEMSMAVVAALITIIGYSLNDTIVVFDRIRENVKLLRSSNIGDVVDTSVTQSLSRTIITSGTTLLAAVALYIFTSGQVKDFALCLIVGIAVGTFSSIYIASPVMMFFTKDTEAAETN